MCYVYACVNIYKCCLIWEFVRCDARSKCIGLSVITVVSKPVIRGVTQSDLRIATGFGPFNLLTCDQLQRGRDHSQLEVQHLWMLYSCVTHVTRVYWVV